VVLGIYDSEIFDTHPDLNGIFHPQSDLGPDYGHTHGTATTAVMAGRSASIQGPWGMSSIKGVAYEATVLFRAGIEEDDLRDGYGGAYTVFIDNNVRAVNNSWAFVIPDQTDYEYSYDADVENIDGYCDNNDMLVVVSAGNDDDAGISAPANAKNVLAVGAIRYATDDNVPDRAIGGRATYSSQGPTADDQRLKPDLVAPGGQTRDYFTRGNCCKYGVVTANALRNGSVSDPEWETDDSYIRVSGTSIASPMVAGACGVILEKYPTIWSETAKALLINTTIPIRANSDNPRAGYANTEVGFGLLNVFSTVGFFDLDEKTNVLIGGSTIDEDNRIHDWPITVPPGSNKLAVTMAYNDEEGELWDHEALIDNLTLLLYPPTSHGLPYIAMQLADGVNTESPLEKIVIENPEAGEWNVQVIYAYSPGFNDPFAYAEQRYGIAVDIFKSEPSLSLTVDDVTNTVSVVAGRGFYVTPEVTNTGRHIAAGVTVKIDAPTEFAGDVNTTRYLGNLMYSGHTKSATMRVIAPEVAGQYTLTVEADGINKEFSNGYPRTRVFVVDVCAPLPPPETPSPPDDAVAQPVDGVIDWEDVPGATSYLVRLCSFCGLFPPTHIVTESEYAYSGLDYGTTYTWEVRSRGTECDPSAEYSQWFSFTTENTPPGPDVAVEDNGHTVTFDEVTDSGETTIEEGEEGAPIPASFLMACDPPAYFNIETTAETSGSIEVCLSLDGLTCDPNVGLLHNVNGEWVELVTYPGPMPNTICAQVNVEVLVTDNADPDADIVLESITSNEPEGERGYGPDIQDAAIGTEDFNFKLRAELVGPASRVYTVVYRATDAAGNHQTKTLLVRVPNDKPGHGLSSTGFSGDGESFDPAQDKFSLVIRSASAVDSQSVAVGNTGGTMRPTDIVVADVDGDTADDLVLTFSTDEAMALLEPPSDEVGQIHLRAWHGRLGLHYRTSNGDDYLVPDIFALGEPVSLSTYSPPVVEASEATVPDADAHGFSIHPNPFNPTTTIQFGLGEPARVTIRIFDVGGRRVRTLVDRSIGAGTHNELWDGKDDRGQDVATGSYFVQLTVGDKRSTRKAVLLK